MTQHGSGVPVKALHSLERLWHLSVGESEARVYNTLDYQCITCTANWSSKEQSNFCAYCGSRDIELTPEY